MPRLSVARPTFNDRYCLFFVIALAGHALIGKAFAYIGAPPLFVTELALVVGLMAMLQTGCILAPLLNIPSLILATLMGLTLIRTIPYVPQYGFEALRDSVLILYGLFAFVVATLLLQKPERVVGAVNVLRWLTTVYVFVGPVVYILGTSSLRRYVPWPMQDLTAPWTRAGELGVHLSCCAVMALVELRSARPVWILGLFLAILVVAAQSRGGFLAIIIPVMLALPFTGLWKRAIVAGMAAVVVLGLAYAIDLRLPSIVPQGEMQAGERVLGVRQAVNNLVSIVGSQENRQLDDTKQFRTLWWQSILNYTFQGRYFWTGKGFGVNLAIDDGFTHAAAQGPPLRSPHNSHFNVLARAGVPGFVLWMLFLASWFCTMLASAIRAWRAGDRPWGNLMLLITCYWLANVVNSTFDVALEGPMMGMWFWSITGFGMGVVTIYRATCSSWMFAGRERDLGTPITAGGREVPSPSGP